MHLRKLESAGASWGQQLGVSSHGKALRRKVTQPFNVVCRLYCTLLLESFRAFQQTWYGTAEQERLVLLSMLGIYSQG